MQRTVRLFIPILGNPEKGMPLYSLGSIFMRREEIISNSATGRDEKSRKVQQLILPSND
jgi:hypothetical protein